MTKRHLRKHQTRLLIGTNNILCLVRGKTKDVCDAIGGGLFQVLFVQPSKLLTSLHTEDSLIILAMLCKRLQNEL
jgi:hypothetical protein